MKISELFFSIQGEGKRAGRLSYFVRTNYCNLRCKFKRGNLCDSDYTSWYPGDENNIGNLSVSEIINDYKKYKPREIVITGGEPTIQLEELEDLCSQLKKLDNDIFITVETNGTLIGDFIDHIDLISISPKLKSSVPFDTEFEKMHEQNRINIEVLQSYNDNFRRRLFDIQWKFVVTSESDVKEILKLKNKIGFNTEEIFLMPESITKKDLEQNRIKVIELSKKHNMNYSDRLHILLWDGKRGY